ncbi:MAG: hypothetical protein DU429_05495 [Candidatus Tokpelaia sp.]|nr:MAG: hypothetical protein DU430_04710 [Candidatus Tokpelaia sp.]KAA6206789.1 MAG: hypothetical protein DU429_05495 [Candidatus Tokpelaia sp.]
MFMRYGIKLFLSLPVLWPGFAALAKADMRLIIVNTAGLPYDLSPDNYDNNPANYDNSPSHYDNSPASFDNSISGNCRLILPDNKPIGYYSFGPNRIIDLYTIKGERVAFISGGGNAKAVIFANGDWCGAVGDINGETVFGVSETCYPGFLM